MLAGKEPPIPAASVLTSAAAASVALYALLRALVSVTGRTPARLVALVLQGLHQPGDLLPEDGEL